MNTFDDVLSFLRIEQLRDTELPYLWSDEALCEYIAQAHDEFAEETQSIRDASSEASEIVLETGVDTYPLNAVVLSVISAKFDGGVTNLVRASASILDGEQPEPEVVRWLEAINSGALMDGTPEAWTTDERVDGVGAAAVIRFYPTPTAADNGKVVRLRVVRLPIVQCSIDTLSQEPEMARQYRMALVHGAAAIAYDNQDADGGDSDRSSKQRVRFDRFIERAKRGTRRKMFQPMSWGFGRGGF